MNRLGKIALGLGAAMLLLGGVRGPRWTLDQLHAGCDDQPRTAPPPWVKQNADLVWAYYLLVCEIMGARVPIRGWWRQTRCNAARGGKPSSKHLEGGAIDIDPTPEQLRLLLGALVRSGTIPSESWDGQISRRTPWGDRVRQRIGRDIGVGLIVYSSGAVHIDVGCVEHEGAECTPRRSDWIDVA